MTTYAIAFNLFSLAIALFCLFLAFMPVRKPCAKQGLALTRFNRVYTVRYNNAAYARACRNIKLLPTTTIPLSIAHIKQQLEQQNYGHTVASKLELSGYYDSYAIAKQ